MVRRAELCVYCCGSVCQLSYKCFTCSTVPESHLKRIYKYLNTLHSKRSSLLMLDCSHELSGQLTVYTQCDTSCAAGSRVFQQRLKITVQNHVNPEAASARSQGTDSTFLACGCPIAELSWQDAFTLCCACCLLASLIQAAQNRRLFRKS